MSDYFDFRDLFLPSKLHKSQMQSSDHISDSSSPGYSESSDIKSFDLEAEIESDVFDNVTTTYQVVGTVSRPSTYDGPEFWVVDIVDPEEIKKINQQRKRRIRTIDDTHIRNTIKKKHKIEINDTWDSTRGRD